MCSTVSPSITAPGSVSSDQLPFPGSSTTPWPPWRNIAVSKLVRVRRLGSMNTIASTFFSSPPVTSPRLTRAASCSSPSTSAGPQSSSARKSRLVTPAPPRGRRGADRPRAWENESGGSSRSTWGSVAVPVRIRRSKSARCTSTAGRSRCSPSSRPRPDTLRTPSAARAAREVLADRDRVGDEPLALDHVDVGERRRAGHRPAAEGAAEIAEGERVGEPRASRPPRRSEARRPAPWRRSARRASRRPPPPR